ncbi:hypothetical protein MRX96_009788 [Rhipicephalus microplus]
MAHEGKGGAHKLSYTHVHWRMRPSRANADAEEEEWGERGESEAGRKPLRGNQKWKLDALFDFFRRPSPGRWMVYSERTTTSESGTHTTTPRRRQTAESLSRGKRAPG